MGHSQKGGTILYNETDPFGAESGVWVNGEEEWIHSGKMGSRKWYRHIAEPPTEPPFDPPVGPPVQPPADALQIRVPDGVKVVAAVSNEPGIVVIVLPPGLKTDIQ